MIVVNYFVSLVKDMTLQLGHPLITIFMFEKFRENAAALKKAKINSPSKMSKNLEVSMVIPHGWSCLNKYLLHKTSVVLFDGKY